MPRICEVLRCLQLTRNFRAAVPGVLRVTARSDLNPIGDFYTNCASRRCVYVIFREIRAILRRHAKSDVTSLLRLEYAASTYLLKHTVECIGQAAIRC